MTHPRVMIDVLEEHFSELDFLWEQRERFVFAADWTLDELAALEERAEAHLDGLRIGGSHAVGIARPFLAGEGTSTATAAAFTLLAMRTPDLANAVIEAVATGTPAVRTGIRIAMRHVDPRPLTDGLYALAVGGDVALRAFAADVLAFHRLRPPPELEVLVHHVDPPVRRLALGAAGRFGGPLTRRDVQAALDTDDAGVRRTGLAAAARIGVAGLADVCREAARSARAVPEAVEFVGVLGEERDAALLRDALMRSATSEAALTGLGALGRPDTLPLLLDAMATPALARAAAAAFTRITGVSELHAAPAAVPPAADDEELPDDGPPPDPARARIAWERLRGRMTGKGRWQAGRDVDALDLLDALRVLPLASRRDVYLNARLRDPAGTPDVELERSAAFHAHFAAR